MFVTVRLLNGFSRPLTYSAPAELSGQLAVGSLVEVPLQKRTTHAMVVSCNARKPSGFAIRPVSGIVARPHDDKYHGWLTALASFYDTSTLHLYSRLYSSIAQHETTKKEEVVVSEVASAPPVTLTDEQQHTVDALTPLVTTAPQFAPTLLHGVTGSGKTEVYKKLIESARETGKTTLFLCPEVSLARQFYALFTKQLPHHSIHSFDSASTKKEKQLLWQDLLEGRPCLITGVHLPILLPISNLGLIIVDEEHEAGFEEKKSPHMNSKHIALWRAREYGIPIVLGSATPSVSTLHHARKDSWRQFSLTKRFSGAFPTIKHVLLNDHHKRKYFWFSDSLVAHIKETTARKEQVIIYVNRRGYSVCMQCKKCAHVYECEQCSVSLTVHKRGDTQQLRCHYCDYSQPVPEECVSCGASTEKSVLKGIGTQQVVQQLEKLFPTLRIARADADVSRRKKEWRQTMDAFANQEIDVLVGTQIITKGYHFPQVTLVGILWGDSNLHFPQYNAHESALQQLIQVAGRAGRFHEQSTVIVQSFSEHPVFNYVSEDTYMQFADQELEMRALTDYPPSGRLMIIELKNKDVLVLERESQAMVRQLTQAADGAVMVLGPAKPAVYKVQGMQSRTIMLKSASFSNLFKLLSCIRKTSYESAWHYVPY